MTNQNQNHIPTQLVGVDPQTGRCSHLDYIWYGGVEFTGADAGSVPFGVALDPDARGNVILPGHQALGDLARDTARFFFDRAELPLTQVKPMDLIVRWASPESAHHRKLVRAALDGTRQRPLVSTQIISRGPDGSWHKNDKVDVPAEARLEVVRTTLGKLMKSHLDVVLGDTYQHVVNIQSLVRERPPEEEPSRSRWSRRRG